MLELSILLEWTSETEAKVLALEVTSDVVLEPPVRSDSCGDRPWKSHVAVVKSQLEALMFPESSVRFERWMLMEARRVPSSVKAEQVAKQ